MTKVDISQIEQQITGKLVAVKNSSDPNTIYFFKGSLYYRYIWDQKEIAPGFPSRIDGRHIGKWYRLPDNLDAAVNHPTDNGLICFFKGNQYFRYYSDWTRQEVEEGYPVPIADKWPGIPANLDAALNHPTDSNLIYFFKGRRYYRYDLRKTKQLTDYKSVGLKLRTESPAVPAGFAAGCCYDSTSNPSFGLRSK